MFFLLYAFGFSLRFFPIFCLLLVQFWFASVSLSVPEYSFGLCPWVWLWVASKLVVSLFLPTFGIRFLSIRPCPIDYQLFFSQMSEAMEAIGHWPIFFLFTEPTFFLYSKYIICTGLLAFGRFFYHAYIWPRPNHQGRLAIFFVVLDCPF